MTESSVLAADRGFFDALLASDGNALERLLAEDFIIVDVMSGGETGRAALLDAIRSGRLKFMEIAASEIRSRVYGNAAVINGRTAMRLSFDDAAFAVKSRYVHVYAELDGEWRMVSAQGTRIAE